MQRVKWAYAVALLAAFVVAVLLVLLRAGPDVPKPSLSCVKVEPAEVLNRNGADLWIVTFCVSNVSTVPFAPEKYVFFRKTPAAVECRKAGVWMKDEEALPTLVYGLEPGGTWISLLLVPTGSESCRVPITYTGGTLAFRAKIGRLAEGLPLLIRSRLPNKFWRWAGFITTVPSRDWREAKITFEISEVATGMQPVD
jgi:hypothetical protein